TRGGRWEAVDIRTAEGARLVASCDCPACVARREVLGLPDRIFTSFTVHRYRHASAVLHNLHMMLCMYGELVSDVDGFVSRNAPEHLKSLSRIRAAIRGEADWRRIHRELLTSDPAAFDVLEVGVLHGRRYSQTRLTDYV
ncbi:MAG: hypothetical protein QXD60_02445, partial [Nanopusillaceae archaeon]